MTSPRRFSVTVGLAVGCLLGLGSPSHEAHASCAEEEVTATNPVVVVIDGDGDPAVERLKWPERAALLGPEELELGDGACTLAEKHHD